MFMNAPVTTPHRNTLPRRIPTEWGAMSSLKHLLLSTADVGGLIPTQLGSMSSLLSLSLGHNHFTVRRYI